MRRNFKLKWKKLCAAALAAGMVVTSCPAGAWGAVGDAENGCLKISGRNGVQDGPSQVLTGKVKQGGANGYDVAVRVKYIDGDAAQKTFKLTIQNGPSWEYREVIAEASVSKGQWVELKRRDINLQKNIQ